MGHITRQLLICLIIAFFVFGLEKDTPPKKCADDKTCTSKQGKCIAGFCRCVGMYAGNGIYCRKADDCPNHWKCSTKKATCMVDPLFPGKPYCICNPGTPKQTKEVVPRCVECIQDADCMQNYLICRAEKCMCKDGLAMGKNKLCEPGPLHPCEGDKDCDSRAKCDLGKCFCQGNSIGNGKYCRDSLQCPANHQCDENSKCVVDTLIPDKPQCVCLDGYRNSTNGKCVEITECFRQKGEDCPIDQICDQDSDGFYNCICRKTGYDVITSGGNSKCQDIDECSNLGICPANSVCVNSDGSYDCKCNDGYTKNESGVCQDVDDCSKTADTCGAGEKCVNVTGEYRCECQQGYSKKDGACVKEECNCKKHEVCYEGKCQCKKTEKGHCVSPIGFRGGSARVSGYLSTFILGVLGSLALSA